MHRQSEIHSYWTEWVFEKKEKKNSSFQGSHFVFVGEDGLGVVVVCVGESVGV